jgi:cystathionine gamma-lyase
LSKRFSFTGSAFSSGSATTAALASLFGQGSHIVSINDVYGGTYRYFNRVAKTFGIETTFVEMTDAENVRSHIRPNTKVNTSIFCMLSL